MNLSFEHITFANYRLTLEVLERIELNRYNKAIHFQKDLDSVFRRIVCHDLKEECTHCSMYSHCPFGLIFQPKIPLEVKRFSYSQNIPYPFAIEPPMQDPDTYFPGNRFCFTMAMIGKAQWFLPYFLVTFETLGRKGLGMHSGRFRVIDFELLNQNDCWESVYTLQDHMVRLPEESLYLHQVLARKAKNTRKIRIRFLTPVSILDRGQRIEPDVVPLFKQLLHQLQALSFFYCGRQMDVNSSAFDQLCGQISVQEKNVHWFEDRAAEDPGLPSGEGVKGYLGTIECSDIPDLFLHLLYFGEHMHAGEASAFGQGCYRIEHLEP